MKKQKTPKYLYPPIKRSDNKPIPVFTIMPGGFKIPAPQFLVEHNLHRTAKFGKAEVEWSAQLLVEFFAHKQRWCTFNLNELGEFCRSKGEKTAGSALFGLICCWFDDAPIVGGAREPKNYIIQFSDQTFAVTTSFIKRLIPNGITPKMVETGAPQ